LLRLLDLAYYLILAGYILLSTEFDFADADKFGLLAGQLGDAATRLGGLMLILGLLHAVTLIALPVVALIDNSTRVSRPLPRWLVVAIGLAAGGGALLAIPSLIAIMVAGTS
ncbi:MAG: hypothetical protein WBM50_04395, partial [Acidimicrobiales bacterium]